MRLLATALLGYALLAQTPGLLEQAESAFREGNATQAASLARQVLAKQPNSIQAHMILGVVAAQASDWTSSDRHFQAIVRLDPANPYGYFYLGQAKLYQQQWEAAIPYFQKSLERNYPEPERLLIEMALAQNEAGRPQQALATLVKVTAPADPVLGSQYHAVTAFGLARLGRLTEAVDAIRRALELDDTNVHNWDFLIGNLVILDQAPQALAEAIKAQKRFPDHPDIQFRFALASHHVNESPLGKLALRNLREAEPDSPRVLLAEGLLHRKYGRTAEATKAFEKAAERGVSDAHLLLGIVYRENGDYPAAEKEYLKAEQANPANGQVMLELGKLFLAQDRLDQARSRLERAEKLMPAASTVHYQLGILYRRLGIADKAEQHFRQSRQQ